MTKRVTLRPTGSWYAPTFFCQQEKTYRATVPEAFELSKIILPSLLDADMVVVLQPHGEWLNYLVHNNKHNSRHSWHYKLPHDGTTTCFPCISCGLKKIERLVAAFRDQLSPVFRNQRDEVRVNENAVCHLNNSNTVRTAKHNNTPQQSNGNHKACLCNKVLFL